MDYTGKLIGISRDIVTGKLHVTFSINEGNEFIRSYEKLKEIDLMDIIVRKFKKKRSLDANAYFHVLNGKIADEMKISKARCKNILISRYGQPEFIADEEIAVIKTNIPVDQMLELETLHTIPCGVEIQNGKEINFYKVYRGSHTYDSKEMSILIDCTVQEAKELGIDTETPDSIEKMKQLYERNLNAQKNKGSAI